MSPYLNAAAFFRAVVREYAHEQIAAMFDGFRCQTPIRLTIRFFREKMKYGTVMPEIIRARWKIMMQQIRLEPNYTAGFVSKPEAGK